MASGQQSKDWGALLAHIGVYHSVMLGVLVWRFSIDGRVFGVVAFLVATDAILDRGWFLARLMCAVRLVVARQSERWSVIVVDQVIHLLLLGMATMVMGQARVVPAITKNVRQVRTLSHVFMLGWLPDKATRNSILALG